jgi:hypothetical protein
MASWDEIWYQLGQLSPIGRAIEGAKQDQRATEAMNAINSAPDLATFSDIKMPTNVYDPDKLAKLNTRITERKGILQAQEAAPVSRMLSRFTAEGNDADPNFSGYDWVKGMATSPTYRNERIVDPQSDVSQGPPKLTSFGVDPSTGQEYFGPDVTYKSTMVSPSPMSDEQYDTAASGAIPGGKKGSSPLSAFAANPITADLLQKAELAAQTKGTLARVFAGGEHANPMDLANVAVDKNLATGYKETAQGIDQFNTTAKRNFEMKEAADKEARAKAAWEAYINHPTVDTPESRAELARVVSAAGGTFDVVNPILERFSKVNNPQMTVEQLTARAQKGDKEAQGILDAIQQREIELAKAKRQVIVNNPAGRAGSTPVGGMVGPLNAQGVNPNALQGLDPGRQALIKKIANYEIPIPNSRSKEGIALLARVSLYDPSFDNQQYAIRQSLRKSFTSGPDAKNITSLNTAVHHLDQLDNSFTALGNRAMPAWNYVANKFESGTGDDKLIKVVNDLNAVKGELAATFKGTGATDQEIKAWQDGFSSSSSPAQGKASVREGVKLLQGRLDALIDKYQSGMGKSVDIPILSPKSLHTLEKLGVNVDRYKALGGDTNSNAANGSISDLQAAAQAELARRRGR